MVKYSNTKDTVDSSKLIDVTYEDLITDPIGMTKMIYKNFNFDLDIKTENSMVSYLSKLPGGHKNKHVYTPEEFGLTKELIQKELSF